VRTGEVRLGKLALKAGSVANVFTSGDTLEGSASATSSRWCSVKLQVKLPSVIFRKKSPSWPLSWQSPPLVVDGKKLISVLAVVKPGPLLPSRPIRPSVPADFQASDPAGLLNRQKIIFV
jgi:hypothetical protein